MEYQWHLGDYIARSNSLPRPLTDTNVKTFFSDYKIRLNSWGHAHGQTITQKNPSIYR